MLNCAFCEQPSLTEIMDFGAVALAGGFLSRAQIEHEKKYPLRLMFCQGCYAVQLADRIDADTLFRNYFYFSSAIGSVRAHSKRYAAEVTKRFNPHSVLEFGCNDGVLLAELVACGVPHVIGVDPAGNVTGTITADVRVVDDYFTEAVAEKYGEVDMVIANNVFAHIPDINGATRAVRKALSADGVFVMEAHYLGAMLDKLQYDWIYHEHMYYYSLTALVKHFARHGMAVFDVEPVPTHGGSMRYYVCKKGSRSATPRTWRMLCDEYERGLHLDSTFKLFSEDIETHKRTLMDLLTSLRGNTIAGYGASGRANALMQFCGIDSRHVAYIIDDAPAKHGRYTPGTHIEVVARDALATRTPDYLLVFAWNYLDEIAVKCGDFSGNVVVPFPKVSMHRFYEQNGKRAVM